MNRLTSRIIQLGVVLGIIVVFVDFFFSPLTPLDWLALTVSFAFAAVMIVDSIASLVPKRFAQKETVNVRSERDHGDAFRELEDLVEGAVYRHHDESMELLTIRLRSLLLGVAATRSRLTKEQLRVLSKHDASALAAQAKNRQLASLISRPGHADLNAHELDDLLSKIEDWLS